MRLQGTTGHLRLGRDNPSQENGLPVRLLQVTELGRRRSGNRPGESDRKAEAEPKC